MYNTESHVKQVTCEASDQPKLLDVWQNNQGKWVNNPFWAKLAEWFLPKGAKVEVNSISQSSWMILSLRQLSAAKIE